MARRIPLLSVLMILAVPLSLFAAPPNLLIITVDDMSADSLGSFGCPLEGTSPHIDALAAQGMKFEHAHVQVGNCMPSRNVMWSGLYPHHNHVEGFYQVKSATHPHLVDLMKQGGYFTGIRHKVSHSTPYSPYAWDINLDTDVPGEKPHSKDPASYGVSTTQGIAAAEKAGKPFCLVINVADPHKPFYGETKGKRNSDQPEDPYVPSKTFSPKEVPVPGFLFDDPAVRKELASYYDTVRRADDAVGAILSALKESGKQNETVILFLSDHGMPLPFAKTQLYHHSTRTPLIVVWPGHIKPASVDDSHLVSAVDLLPTLLDVCDIESPQQMDGRSFLPLLYGKPQTDRDVVFKEYNENAGGSRDPMRGVQTKQFLYLFNPWSNGTRSMATATKGTATYRRMKALAPENPEIAARLQLLDYRVLEELYDVEHDPDCLHNLIDDPQYQMQAEQMRTRLENWMMRTEDPLLDVFRRREDAAYRESVIQKSEKEAEQRRPKKKRQRPRRRT